MDLAQITVRLQTLWQQLPQKRVTQALMVVLFIYITYWFANFTWALFPDTEQNTAVKTVQNVSGSQKQVDINAINQLNLFGEYQKQQEIAPVVTQIESAPETRLKLTLTGLVASDNPNTAAAIIESQGKQETYGVDDKITGTRAILKQVQTDRVIIQSSGRMETLMLDGFDYTDKVSEPSIKAQSTSKKVSLTNKNKAVAKKTDPVKQERIKERVAQARAEILANPGKLTDYIRVSPYRVDGKVKGYRLMPSKNPEFFSGVGLIAGDIAIQINGKDLTDMREAQKALIELRKSEHVDLLVERDGELHDISLGLNN